MSNKHTPLTEEEFSTYNINPLFLSALETVEKPGRFMSRAEIRVLDWGCGRGRNVLKLRELGYSSYGVDIDPDPIRNGSVLFRKRDLEPEKLLNVIQPGGKLDFPDNFFHLVISDRVFEHIADLEKVSQEISRVTQVNGFGFHIYPGHRVIREGHLYMPFIHWLPKNKFRYWLIALYLRLGISPAWQEVEGKPLGEQAEIYYQYSIGKTFYRSPRQVRSIFNRNRLQVQFVTKENPRLQEFKLLHAMVTRSRFLSSVINFLLITFRQVCLRTQKAVTIGTNTWKSNWM